MEGHVASIEDSLVDSLSFKLRPGASYVSNRRSVTFWAGGNSYSPTGVKVIKINLNSDDWLDPATVKLFFTIKNTTTAVPPNPMTSGWTANNYTDLIPLSPGPWIFFRRMRILCGGQIVEDIDTYNRLHEMFHMLKPTDKVVNDFIEGFGIRETNGSYGLDQTAIRYASPLEKGESQTVGFTPFAGLFRQEKFLPLRDAPISIELEVVGDGEHATQGSTSSLGQSKYFEISDVQFKCDLCQLDSSLDNEYTAYLLSGKTLPIHYTAITHASQTLPSGPLNHSVNVSRAFTRLKAVFISLYAEITGTPADNDANFFYHPMGANKYNFDKEMEISCQLGSHVFPEYPIRSLAEAYYNLRKTLGIHIGNEGMNVAQRFYRSLSFVTGIDFTKVSGSPWTGASTKAGDLMTIKLKSANSQVTLSSSYTHKLYYTLVSDGILQIGVSGVNVLE